MLNSMDGWLIKSVRIQLIIGAVTRCNLKGIERNKTCILTFYQTMSGARKTKELVSLFTDDLKLIRHILYLESLIPHFALLIDEIIAEGSKVIVRARCRGIQTGKINHDPPTYRKVEFPYAMGYYISDGKITDHWMISDQIAFLEQMGILEDVR